MRLKPVWHLVKEAIGSWKQDYAPSMGAAIAYYTMFSIAPLLLIVISIAGFFFGGEAVQGQVLTQLEGLMGKQGAEGIEEMLARVNRPEEGFFGTLIGAVVLLIGASTVFAEIQGALDRIWRAPARKQGSGLWSLLRGRLLSFGMILGVAFLLMVSLVMDAGLAAFAKWWNPVLGAWEVLAHGANLVVTFGLFTVVFAMIYKFMPSVSIRWHDVWIGAAVTSVLFAAGKFLIGLYLGKSEIGTSFGAAGSVVIVMVWVYYSAQIFLLGAEFTWVYAHEFGSRKGRPRPKPDAQAAEDSGQGQSQTQAPTAAVSPTAPAAPRILDMAAARVAMPPLPDDSWRAAALPGSTPQQAVSAPVQALPGVSPRGGNGLGALGVAVAGVAAAGMAYVLYRSSSAPRPAAPSPWWHKLT